MVIRVNEDGSLMPFEIMPELFLGRSIRQLLTPEVRARFEDACRDVVASRSAQIFVPEGFGDTDEVMVAPVLDDDQDRCRFLVCWVRQNAPVGQVGLGGQCLRWRDLELDAIEVRFRAVDDSCIEAAPWWVPAGTGVALWDHHHRVASLGLAAAVMQLVVVEAVPVLADHDAVRLRIDVPAPEMLNGLLQALHGTIRAAGVDPSRVVLGVPVEMAVDHDLLPLIVHLRTLGTTIDIVGLDALTAKLHTVSDTSDHQHVLPQFTPEPTGSWSTNVAHAVRDTIHP